MDPADPIPPPVDQGIDRVDPATGQLLPTGQSQAVSGPDPCGPEPELIKFISLLLHAQGYTVSPPFLALITSHAARYLHRSAQHIKKLAEIQRRTRPSLNDVRLSFKLRLVKWKYLYIELVRGSVIRTRYARELARASASAAAIGASLGASGARDGTTDGSNSSTSGPFGPTGPGITSLVPRLKQKPPYIPPYLPDLPPDYTYQHTASYIPTLTDMEQLRVRLVDESRMTEKSLYGLIGTEGTNGPGELGDRAQADSPASEADIPGASPGASASSSPSPIFDKPELPQYAEEAPEPEPHQKPVAKAFDVVDYARKRLQARAKRAQDVDQRRAKRNQNIFIDAERYYSAYATKPITNQTHLQFQLVLDSEFTAVVRRVRAGRRAQRQKIDRLRQKVRPVEVEAEKFEFQFHGSSEEEEEEEFEPEFEPTFGPAEPGPGTGTGLPPPFSGLPGPEALEPERPTVSSKQPPRQPQPLALALPPAALALPPADLAPDLALPTEIPDFPDVSDISDDDLEDVA